MKKKPPSEHRTKPWHLKDPIKRSAPPIPDNEKARLQEVLDLHLQNLAAPDELVALRDTAQRLLGVQTAVISTIESDIMRILTAKFSPHRDVGQGQILELQDFSIPRDCTLCQNTIMETDYLIIPNSGQFIIHDSPKAFPADFREQTRQLGGYPTPWPNMHDDMGLQGSTFYAGAVIRSSKGHNLGSFCVMDQQGRPDFSIDEIRILSHLAQLAAHYLEKRALLSHSPNLRLVQNLNRLPSKDDRLVVSSEVEDVDAVIIGGGPAGTTAACRLAFRGQKVALVEPQENFGAPTGITSKIFREAALRYGANTTWENIESLLKTIGFHEAKRVRALLEQYGVQIIKGRAHIKKIEGASEDNLKQSIVQIKCEGGQEIKLRTVSTVFATGSRARRLKNFPFDERNIFDADSIEFIGRKPASVLIQGGGLIGVEYAMIFAKMGVHVELAVHYSCEKILPQLDRSLVNALIEDIASLNIGLYYETDIKEVIKTDAGEVQVTLKNTDGELVKTYEIMLSAVGRIPNLEKLGLEIYYEGAAKMDQGKELTNKQQRLHHVDAAAYAIGDVSGGPGLACHAVLQAQRAADDLLHILVQGRSTSPPLTTAPGGLHSQHPASVLWTIPEISFVGLSEEEAINLHGGNNIICGKGFFSDSVRGSLVGLPSCWFVKLVCRRLDGRILGVHLYGEQSSELVHYGADLVNEPATAFSLQYRIFPAVTLHEVYRVAANSVIEKILKETQ